MSPKHYPGQRLFRIIARTIHIGASAMLLGAATFSDTIPAPIVPVLLLSASWIVANDLYKYSTSYLRYVQSWVIMAKFALLAIGLSSPPLLLPCLWTSLILGALISHAPGSIRHFALWGDAGPCGSSKKKRPSIPSINSE